MEQSILKSFLEKGFLLDRELVNFFSELNDEELALDIINKISTASKRKIITKRCFYAPAGIKPTSLKGSR